MGQNLHENMEAFCRAGHIYRITCMFIIELQILKATYLIGASLSEPHSNVENVRWSMREEPRRKTGLQHTTVVW